MYNNDITMSYAAIENLRDRQKELITQSMANIRKHKLSK